MNTRRISLWIPVKNVSEGNLSTYQTSELNSETAIAGVLLKKMFLTNLAKFTGKHLC